ncbi:tetratricopeptide repeat protein [Pelagicoccus sp. SDUM812003]|uniref:tetratricopeptide repeat protein n=1 Tax=Pelagicoccus sp. SDUM812003 TaxID=3041267 RepID=UPI00280FC40F|nr:tetratricopeptide repeat protein [Pelagicoccus sp. SDUM812003]MDQ8204057.1 tetratricopeptide repeat protein [Pelagicoccus sp. SDUM812003]
MKHLTSTLLSSAAFCVCALSSAQVYELKEQTFDNPEFRARFIQSYIAESDINPNITAEEKGLFDEIVPLIESDPSAAIARLDVAITSESSAAFDFILGNLLYQENELDEAIAAYEAAIKKFPNYYRAYYNAGRAYVGAGDYANGLKYLQKALSIQTGDSSMYGLIGYCYINLDKPETALDAYRNAIMLEPKSRDWKMGKLQCYIALEQPEDAIGMLYEFIREEPENADWWKLQANQFIAVGSTEKAAANLTVVKDLGKADGAALALHGDLMVNEGLVEEALDSYLKAMDEGGARPYRMLEVANSLIFMGELDAAKSLIAKLESAPSMELSDKQDTDLLNLKARLAMESDDVDGAAGFLAEVVDKDPLNGEALLTLSELEKGRGNFAKAEYYAENASKIDAYAHKALLSLAQLNVTKRDYGSAAKYLRQAQQIDPRDYVADYLLRVEQAALRM